MVNVKRNPKDVPVSVFIAVSMIVVFLLFNAKVITALPCGKGMREVFMSNFVHIDAMHLISNLYALYAVSRVEQEMGFQSFIWLLIFLLIVNTLAEFIAKRIWQDMPCSIGFSGILFGLLTWELVSTRKFDVEVFLAIIIMVVGPSLTNKKASLSGHIIGAISGILGGFAWKILHKQ